MARGAIVLILFAFCVCLSCLSSSAVGSGIFYACSDGTMSPGEFDFNKCLDFGLSDISSGTGAVTGLDIGDDKADDTPKSQNTGSVDLLVPSGVFGNEDADVEFLDYFDRGSDENLNGKGVTIPGSKSKIECAKICYNEEVEMPSAGETCNGFVSDGFSRCILFPSNSRVSGSKLIKGRKSYVLKEGRDGNPIITYNTQKFHSRTFFDGHPATVGFPKGDAKRNFPDCSNDNVNGMLTGFKLESLGKPTAQNVQQMRYSYTCLMNEDIKAERNRTSGWVGAWDTSTCGGKKKKWSGGKSTRAASWKPLAQAPIDCGNKFINKWFMQTSTDNGTEDYDLRVDYKCTKQETSDASSCVDKSTADVGGERCRISEFKSQNVQCPSGMAITKLVIGNGKTTYRCCPRPDLRKDGTVVDKGSSSVGL